MAGKSRHYKAGGSDPRSGVERLAGLINRGVSSKAIKSQDRKYDDSHAKRAKNIAAADAEQKRRGVTSRTPKKGKK